MTELTSLRNKGTIREVKQGSRVLQTELTSLLNKGTIREVKLGDRQVGFYSRYFLVLPNGMGACSPFSDLRGLN